VTKQIQELINLILSKPSSEYDKILRLWVLAILLELNFSGENEAITLIFKYIGKRMSSGAAVEVLAFTVGFIVDDISTGQEEALNYLLPEFREAFEN